MSTNVTTRLGGARAQLAVKAPARVATTANITLSGFQTIDGVTLASGDANLRVFVKDQDDATENGIWDAKSGAWTRALDFDGSDDVVTGTRIFVAPGGSTYGNSEWVVSTTGAIIPGTTALAFARHSSYAGLQTLWIPASAMVPRVTNGAAFGITEHPTNDVMMATLDFDQTTKEGAGFSIAFPKGWDKGTVTFQPFWTAASGSGGVMFALYGVSISDDDAIDEVVGAAGTSTDTLIATGDLHVGPISGAVTIAGTPADDDLVYFLIERAVNNVSDTLTADARLIGIKLYYTNTTYADD